jgi:hypothetical protein
MLFYKKSWENWEDWKGRWGKKIQYLRVWWGQPCQNVEVSVNHGSL